MNVVAILQARMSSTRLPGKVFLPLAGKPMLQHIIERVQRAKRIDAVCVAHPDANRPAHLAFKDVFAQCHGQVYEDAYEGDERDLVGRYLSAALAMRADIIVRIPCDNPCVDPFYIDAAVEEYLTCPFVYYSNTTDAVAVGEQVRMVDGIGAEVVSISRLKWLDGVTQGQPQLREHPHRYFEQCGLLQLPKADLRLDVNTQADYEGIKSIYDALYSANPHFTPADILTHLEVHGRTTTV